MDWIGAGRLPLLRRRNYYYEFLHTLPWGLVAGVVESNFGAIVARQTFGGSALLVWVASSSYVAMYITSLFWGALCAGRSKLRLLTLCTSAVAVVLATIAATPRSEFGAWCFVAQMAAAQFFMAGAVTVRTGIWKENYPVTVRGQATARFQMIRAVTGIVAVFAAAMVFDRSPGAYRLVYPFVALCGLAASVILRRVRVRGERRDLLAFRENARRQDAPELFGTVGPLAALSPVLMVRRTVRVFREDPRYFRYCASLMCAGIGNLLVHTVVVLVIVDEMLADVSDRRNVYLISTLLLDVINSLVMLYALARLGRVFDRVGIVRFRVASGSCWTVSIVLGTVGTLLVVYGDRIGAGALIWCVLAFVGRAVFLGIGRAGGALAYNLGHLHFARPDRAELYMGIHVMLTGVRGLTMPGLGVLLWLWVGWPVWLIAIGFSVLGVLGYSLLVRDEDQEGGHASTVSPRT